MYIVESRLIRTLFVLMLRRNLFSVVAVERRDLRAKFVADEMRVMMKNDHVCAVGRIGVEVDGSFLLHTVS